MLVLLSGAVVAHDGTSYGGIYRSRDGGGSWLPVDVGLFLRAAVALAVDPSDPSHLLLGTDSGLLRSRNGGRQWTRVAGELIAGPVTAVALEPGGTVALAADPAGLYRFSGGSWRRVEVPATALPVRALEPGAVPGRFWLLGRARLFRSDDGGRSFARVADDLPGAARMTGLAVLRGPAERLIAVIDGRLSVSDDGGRRWLDRSPATPSTSWPPTPSGRTGCGPPPPTESCSATTGATASESSAHRCPILRPRYAASLPTRPAGC